MNNDKTKTLSDSLPKRLAFGKNTGQMLYETSNDEIETNKIRLQTLSKEIDQWIKNENIRHNL
jgi:hypothetical protein